MPQSLILKTGSRLHFGPLSYRPQAGRHFGGCGVMISEPGIELETTVAAKDEVVGAAADRISRFVERFRDYFGERLEVPPVRINVREMLPSHVGLGSGTQLALAVAQSLAILSGHSSLSMEELARAMGRGARSAIGINGFQRGGLYVEGGKRTDSELGTPITRLELPPNWCFLIVRPQSIAGLHGEAEKIAFDQLGPMPEETTAKLCRILVMDLLPAVVAADYPAAGSALYEYGATAGEFFAPVQGGIFASPQMRELALLLQREEVPGVGQSSWGPTLFALMPDRERADFWRNRLQNEAIGDGLVAQIGEPLTHGAVIEFK
ncbi:MAG: beta-RFAP synthase [Planctomyces sp.]|nr:beta-RFAP synthase [Planctomyces sp.]